LQVPYKDRFQALSEPDKVGPEDGVPRLPQPVSVSCDLNLLANALNFQGETAIQLGTRRGQVLEKENRRRFVFSLTATLKQVR